MGFVKLLATHKEGILQAWFDLVVETYPPDTAKFLKNQKDPFANPVGETTLKSLSGLYDVLLTDFEATTAAALLDPLIRIRAVQSFTPSQATGFIFKLKPIIRKALTADMAGAAGLNGHGDELLAVDAKIDAIGLLAFDIYTQCREKVHELRATESRNMMFKALERAGLVAEISNAKS